MAQSFGRAGEARARRDCERRRTGDDVGIVVASIGEDFITSELDIVGRLLVFLLHETSAA
jgi:hypothetical protein